MHCSRQQQPGSDQEALPHPFNGSKDIMEKLEMKELTSLQLRGHSSLK